MPDEPFDVEEMIRENFSPEALETLQSVLGIYEPPEYSWVTIRDQRWAMCLRCGTIVVETEIHNQYHKNLTFTIKLIQAYIISHLGHHEGLEPLAPS